MNDTAHKSRIEDDGTERNPKRTVHCSCGWHGPSFCGCETCRKMVDKSLAVQHAAHVEAERTRCPTCNGTGWIAQEPTDDRSES